MKLILLHGIIGIVGLTSDKVTEIAHSIQAALKLDLSSEYEVKIFFSTSNEFEGLKIETLYPKFITKEEFVEMEPSIELVEQLKKIVLPSLNT